MSHYKKLAKDTMIYGLGTIIPRFLNFIVLTPYFTYNVTKNEFGIVSEVYAYAYILLVILTYGTETGYFRFANNSGYNEKSVYNNIFTSLLITSLVFIVLSNIIIKNISELIDFGGKIIHLRIFTFIMFIDVIATIPFAKLRMEKKIVYFSLIKIANVLVNITIIVFLLSIVPKSKLVNEISFLKEFSEDKILSILTANLIASFITLILLGKEILKATFKIEIETLKSILIYSLPLLIAGISGALNETLDKIVLRFLIKSPGNEYGMLGIYNASYKLAMIITLFIQMFRFAAEPYFFNIEKEKDSKKVYANVLKYFVIFVLGIFLLINLYIDYFQFYIGPSFREGLFIVPIILFAYVLNGILVNIDFWFKLSGLTKYAMYIIGLGAIITIAGNFILVPIIGMKGSAWTNVFSYGSMLIISFFLGRKYYRINYDLKSILFYVILTSIIFVAGYFVKIDNLILKTIYSTFLLSIYVFIVNRRENLFKSLMKNENKNS